MSKVQSPKLKGALCNISIDVVDACKILPCLVDSNDIIIVQLKRKLQYRGHIYFEIFAVFRTKDTIYLSQMFVEKCQFFNQNYQ